MTYEGKYLTGLDFPVGALGGCVIRMSGKAEREWWQIFNNFEERKGSGTLPNSFFAVRTAPAGGDGVAVRALQTSAVGPFAPMRSLSFQGESPVLKDEFTVRLGRRRLTPVRIPQPRVRSPVAFFPKTPHIESKDGYGMCFS